MDSDPIVRSAMPGMTWPGLPAGDGATLLAILHQLDQTQWLPAAELERQQLRQLDVLARHAYSTAPYYRKHWGDLYEPGRPLTRAAVSELPVIRRVDLQSNFDGMRSARVPPGHGAVVEGRTSGSTGSPVRTLKAAGLSNLWWSALTLRDHLWHRRDFSGTLAAIRLGVPEAEAPGWGSATDAVLATGRSCMLPIGTRIEGQIEWLLKQQPDYLLTYPSNVLELARYSAAHGIRLPRLREVRTVGELLTPEARDWVRQAWGVPVTDMYTTNENGYVALQCPEGLHYHVQSESVLVEVLDARGKACEPGETGRLVITSLHNFAMPLVRYEIGDYAEVGPPCACGRGLPVLKRILGRQRNMLLLADGSRFWPTFGNRSMTDVAPVRQFQFVQKSFDAIEGRLVTERPLLADEEERLRQLVLSKLPASFDLKFVYVRDIPRSSGGKFEDFYSEIAQAAPGDGV